MRNFFVDCLVAIVDVGIFVCWTRLSICADKVGKWREAFDPLTVTKATTQFRHSIVNRCLYMINSEGSEDFPRPPLRDCIPISATAFSSAVNKPRRVFRKYFLPAIKGTGPCASMLDTRDCWVIRYGVVSGFIRIWP